MKSNLFASQSGMILAAAGIAVAELAVSFATSATSPVQASPVEISSQADSVELAEQSSVNPTAKDDDDKPDKPDKPKKAKDDDDDDDDDDDNDDDKTESATCSCSEGVFKDVSKKTGIEKSKLRLVKVERQTWSDSCLGLGNTGSTCSQSMVRGWRVIVASGDQRWVYRSNESGSMVKLDEVATRTLTGSETTTLTRREEVTTRTSQTNQAATGSSSQSSQTVVGNIQTTAGASTRTQQQTRLTRNLARVNFTDISQSYWARDFIMAMAQRGILTGFPDGKFHPDKPVTRAEFAALVASVFKKNKVRNAVSFRDVATSYWAYNGIREAYEMGFLSPISGGQFRPYESLTRLQVLTALAKGLNYTTSGSIDQILQVYSDASSIPAEARSLVAAATERGIVVNYPNVSTCSPNKVATRAEVAALLYQAMVSNGDAVAISSPYIAGKGGRVREAGTVRQTGERKKPPCNQGIGNGGEGCDPGNSRPHGGSNDGDDDDDD